MERFDYGDYDYMYWSVNVFCKVSINWCFYIYINFYINDWYMEWSLVFVFSINSINYIKIVFIKGFFMDLLLIKFVNIDILKIINIIIVL